MKKLLSLSLLIFNTFLIFSQKECSQIKSKHQIEKSNTLSISQIEKTEKYNVHYYALDLHLNNTSTQIAGTVSIYAFTNTFLDSALIELHDTYTINSIQLNGNPTTYKRLNSGIYIPVNLTKDQPFTITVDYNGTAPTYTTTPLGGSGLTNKTDIDYNTKITSSLSQPFSAYEWWPCKQSLTDKADSSEVKITVPSNCMAGSNGLLKNTIDLGNGFKRFEWKHNHPIDYYLISVAVGEYTDYSFYTKSIGNYPPILVQNYIYNQSNCLNDWKFEIDLTANFIELFSDLFGIYPFYNEKYGHCMSPIGGGMEHQTMTTQQGFNKNLTAHELGHQWWGDNVTCGSWSDIWLNEGFATYAQYLMLEKLFPSEHKIQMEDYHNNAMQYLDGSVFVKDSLNTNRIFNYRLTYAKGAAIIHTLRFIINNDDLFFEGLRAYQSKFKNKTAKLIDFKNTMESICQIDLTNFFNEWYYGEGYPTYNVKWNCINNDLSLQIGQYPSGAFLTQKFTNPLEITFSRENDNDTTIRFNIKELTNQFIIPSIGKVNSVKMIDPNNWILNHTDSSTYDPNFEVNNDSINETFIQSFKVMPNPTDSKFQVITQTPELHSISITDLSGKELDLQIFNKSIELNISSYSSGIYLLKVKSQFGKTEYFKIVKT